MVFLTYETALELMGMEEPELHEKKMRLTARMQGIMGINHWVWWDDEAGREGFLYIGEGSPAMSLGNAAMNLPLIGCITDDEDWRRMEGSL